MSAEPAVSVVVPLFNKRATIGRTLASVLGQTFADWELLVVDDGSSDGSADYVEACFQDPRVQLLRQANAGPARARNNGAAVAKGQFITFLDADDAWRPEFLERAVEHLARHPECEAFTAAFFLEPEGNDRWQPLRAFGFREGEWRLTPDIPREHLTHCLDAFHPTTALYRRGVVLRYGGFFDEQRCTFGEDVFLWLQIMLNHSIYRHMEPLAHYHTEDSELGIGGRRGPLPLEPVLTHAQRIRAVAPPELKTTLELWLAKHAARAAFMQIERGDLAKARWLLHEFPLIREFAGDYWKLKARLALPTVWRSARLLVNFASGSLGR